MAGMAGQSAPVPGNPASYSRDHEPELSEEDLDAAIHYLHQNPRHSWEQAKLYVLGKKAGAAVGRKKVPGDAPVGPPQHHQRRRAAEDGDGWIEELG
jgi:hypothetical protein